MGLRIMFLIMTGSDWEKADRAVDEEEGKRLVDAAKAVGVQHFVWSCVSSN